MTGKWRGAQGSERPWLRIPFEELRAPCGGQKPLKPRFGQDAGGAASVDGEELPLAPSISVDGACGGKPCGVRSTCDSAAHGNFFFFSPSLTQTPPFIIFFKIVAASRAAVQPSHRTQPPANRDPQAQAGSQPAFVNETSLALCPLSTLRQQNRVVAPRPRGPQTEDIHSLALCGKKVCRLF